MALEGTAARQYLVEHRAKRKLIGGLMQGPASHLLRRHVDGSSHDHPPAVRQVGVSMSSGRPQRQSCAMALCQSKVQNLDPLPSRNHDVFGFQEL